MTPRRLPTTALRLLLVLAAGLLAACSRLAYLNPVVAYQNAPPMIAWFVDDYVDLSGPQKAWLRERLEREMAWHRTRELPEYRRFLGSVAAHADTPFTTDEVARAYGELRVDYHRLVEHLLPGFGDFLLTLDDRQLEHLQRKFSDDNAKVAKDAQKGTPQKRRDEAAKKAIGHIEPWTGRLTREQRAIVAERIGRFPDTLEDRLADRRYRQAEIVALVRTHDRERVMAGLRRLLVDTDSWRRASYQDKIRERDRQLFTMIATLSASLSPEQRAHLKSRIADYMDDMTRLASSR